MKQKEKYSIQLYPHIIYAAMIKKIWFRCSFEEDSIQSDLVLAICGPQISHFTIGQFVPTRLRRFQSSKMNAHE
jgi:hypothetical protein